MKELTNEQAKKLVIATIRSILASKSGGKIVDFFYWKSKREEVRKNVYDLVRYRAHQILGIPVKTLSKRISQKSKISIYSLNMLQDAAIIELRLGLKQGKIAADALAKLKVIVKKDEERLAILKIAYRKRYHLNTPTIANIVDAFELHNAKQTNSLL